MWEFWISKLVFQLNKMIPSNFTVFLKPGWTVSAWSMKMFKYRRDASASEHHLQCQGLFRGGQQVRGESQIWSKLSAPSSLILSSYPLSPPSGSSPSFAFSGGCSLLSRSSPFTFVSRVFSEWLIPAPYEPYVQTPYMHRPVVRWSLFHLFHLFLFLRCP